MSSVSRVVSTAQSRTAPVTDSAVRRLRRSLQEPREHRLSLDRVAERTEWCIGFFYLGVLILAVDRAVELLAIDARQIVDPLWPVAWVPSVAESPVGFALALALVGTTFLSTFLYRSRVVRIATAVSFWEAAALLNSFGKVSHRDHMILWILLVFVFLPTMRRWTDKRSDRFSRVEVFWYAQMLVMFFYCLTGFWKVVGWGYQFLAGQPHLLQVDSLARHVAVRLMQTDSTTPFGELFVRHAWLGWPLFVGVIYLEWGSIFIPFRPRLHRIWGTALISMHLGIGWVMGIWFHPSILVCGVLLVMSPFQRPDESLLPLSDLPGVPLVRKLLSRFRSN